MNPIDFLKIKELSRGVTQKNLFGGKILSVKVNSDDSVDFLFEYDNTFCNISTKDIIRLFNIKDKSIEFPFKFNNVNRDLLIIKDCDISFKSLKNFPNYCAGNVSIMNTVESLEGIGYVRGNLEVHLKNYEKYKTKEDVLKDYPNLRIGKYLILCEHEFDPHAVHIENNIIKFIDIEKT